jgi:circadian clock protein KaiC
MGLHFIREGVNNNEPGVYVGFQENPVQLARIMSHFDWNVEDTFQNESFEFMYRSPVELQLDSVASELFARVRQGRVKRVVIDAVGDLRNSGSDKERFSDFMYALTQWFATQNVTCLLLYEVNTLFNTSRISDEELSNMSDNIVLLSFLADAEMSRTVRIIKTRGSAHDHRQHLLNIEKAGVTVKKFH